MKAYQNVEIDPVTHKINTFTAGHLHGYLYLNARGFKAGF
jgi:hypothetical protein